MLPSALNGFVCGIAAKYPYHDRWVMRIYDGRYTLRYHELSAHIPVLIQWCGEVFEHEHDVELKWNSGDPYIQLVLTNENDLAAFSLLWADRIR